jgi:predicted nucleic acid-binding protein
VLVTDAGIWVRAIVDEGPEGPVRARLARESQVAAPALIDLEFANVLRGLVLKSRLEVRRAQTAINQFLQAPVQRYGHEALLPRVWRLRDNLTAYDASYVALAEMLGGTLLTIDVRLAGVRGVRCPVEVVP